ncbi:DUF4339 domain-containing protein [Coraliomargarita algicola]|uniref:DUF4339 domain-containing protein n=1 Tax=Coraliomargarita algicola TaxID=3092156 RepID=A0ABZ0RHF7_9BACT|nr:DUF4339 domain-containing protein [Coraliomargarita sp. J2-16]WPJ94387.1 DUF4339 domain-containing protein [Coraliomargarita sp. J2-16]
MDKKYYILHNQEQLGPVSEEELREKLSTGEYSYFDLCWHEEMSDWSPISETLQFEGGKVPPPSPPNMPPPPVHIPPGNQLQQNAINWKPALLWMSIATACSLGSNISSFVFYRNKNDSLEIILSIPSIVAIIYACILHYKCWQAIDESSRVTTPGKAVGLMFVPIYNFYWAFITWPKLVGGLRKSGYTLPYETGGLALAFSILTVCALTLAWFPYFAVLIEIGHLTLFILLYSQVVGAINLQQMHSEN